MIHKIIMIAKRETRIHSLINEKMDILVGAQTLNSLPIQEHRFDVRIENNNIMESIIRHSERIVKEQAVILLELTISRLDIIQKLEKQVEIQEQILSGIKIKKYLP